MAEPGVGERRIEMRSWIWTIAVSCFFVAATDYCGAQEKTSDKPTPPFELRESQRPDVKISVINALEKPLKFGGYPADQFPVLAYSRSKKAPTSVLLGVSFTYRDAGGEQRSVFLTLTQPHALSDATGTITFSEIENFQLGVTLGMQVKGEGTLLVALYEAIADNSIVNAGTTTGGNAPMTFYSEKQKSSSSYGRQVSNILKINAIAGGQ